MLKAMIFIDGTWLYYSKAKLGEPGEDFNLDYGKLPSAISAQLSESLGDAQLDVVRTHLFGSYADNHDPRDDEAARRQKDFFAMLKERYAYEVQVFPVDFRGRRLRRADRDPEDSFEPREKCVDVALATEMLYYAAIPGCYDIAIAVVGDVNFLPLLSAVRRLGKRVAVASIRDCCCSEIGDPRDARGLRDFRVVWLDELMGELELTFTRHQLRCESPLHRGDPQVWTTYHPTRGERFYCDECRNLFAQRREGNGEAPERHDTPSDEPLAGEIKTTFEDRGFGFIQADDGNDYFFHLTDLVDLDFHELELGQGVTFSVKRPPTADKAGAAMRVQAEGDLAEDYDDEFATDAAYDDEGPYDDQYDEDADEYEDAEGLPPDDDDVPREVAAPDDGQQATLSEVTSGGNGTGKVGGETVRPATGHEGPETVQG